MEGPLTHLGILLAPFCSGGSSSGSSSSGGGAALATAAGAAAAAATAVAAAPAVAASAAAVAVAAAAWSPGGCPKINHPKAPPKIMKHATLEGPQKHHKSIKMEPCLTPRAWEARSGTRCTERPRRNAWTPPETFRVASLASLGDWVAFWSTADSENVQRRPNI